MLTQSHIPTIELSANETLWLKEVYLRSSKGQKFTYKDIWSELYQLLPADFNPSKMNPQLISSDGTSIKLLGVIAVVKGYSILDEIDKVIFSIRGSILQNPDIQNVLIQDIANVTSLPFERVSFILRFLVSDFGNFYSGASYEGQTALFNSIRVDGNDSVYYNYVGYPGIEKLILIKSYESNNMVGESFSLDEMIVASAALDQILKEINEDIKGLKLGQEIIWTDILNEINELKSLYSLSKKNWVRVFVGKVSDMTASGVVSETLSKKIVEYIKPTVTQFLD